MLVEVKIPGVGESIQEATLAEWLKKDGESVEKDEPLFVIETDKVTLEVVATAAGVLHIKAQEGDIVSIGAVVATIDTEAAVTETAPTPAPEKTTATAEPAAPPPPAPSPAEPVREETSPATLSPAVRRLVAEHALDADKIKGTGPNGRITKGDVLAHLEVLKAPAKETEDIAPTSTPSDECTPEEEKVTRKPMTRIRRRIAERLVAAKQNTAMLTTFNEIDMARVMALRKQYKEEFLEKHGVSLGFMSFFIKACVSALMEFPGINAFIEEEDIVYHHYVHMGIAIGSGKGLVVPAIRHAEKRSFAELEQDILHFVDKIKANRLAIADLEGGTFTISNGGVYGSLLSTPILNLPQSGILGLHKIEKRPVVINDEIVIRPMMYVALSYDHRVVDGREAVAFLKSVKDHIENPEQLMLEI
jgi:2-oxoglutarate dehydrogenase E2 component (dihydrolipoamide succinyltransferase)